MEAAYQPNPQRKRAAEPPPSELFLLPTGRGTGEAIQTVAAPPFAELYRVDWFLTKQPGREPGFMHGEPVDEALAC